MPEEDRPKPHHKVNVLVSVDVPNFGALERVVTIG